MRNLARADRHRAPGRSHRRGIGEKLAAGIRFKTVGMEAGIPPRILDAIQGQAPRSVADTYGHVTLKTMAEAINRVPAFDLNELRRAVSRHT